MRWASFGLTVAVLVLTGCGGSTPSERAAPAVPDRFVFERDGKLHRLNGTDAQRLTPTHSDDARETEPAWSPDRTRVAFSRQDDKCEEYEYEGFGCYSIWTINADGTNEQRLTPPSTTVGSNLPEWTANGDQISFRQSPLNDGTTLGDFYVMNADGTSKRRLTKGEAIDLNAVGKKHRAALPGEFVGSLTWSPDGKWVALQLWGGYEPDQGHGAKATNLGIWALNLENGTYKKLAEGAFSPDWSPDGRKIAYDRRPSDGISTLWLMNADGSNERKLSPRKPPREPFMEHDPVWLADGNQLAFLRTGWNAIPEIYVVTTVGERRNPRRVLANATSFRLNPLLLRETANPSA
jgi:Tol biopolymer transport system component